MRLLLGLLPLVRCAPCDLPVKRIEQGVLQRSSPSQQEWAAAFDVSVAEWQAVVQDEEEAEELRELLEQGYTDWASQKLAESHLSIDVSQRNRLRAAKQVTEFVLQNSKIGELYANRRLAEATPLFYFLGFGVPEEIAPFHQELRTMWKISRTSRFADGLPKGTKECLALWQQATAASTEEQLARQLCKCSDLWVCGQHGAEKDLHLVRVTLKEPPVNLQDLDLEGLVQLKGVRVLEFESCEWLRAGSFKVVASVFPNVRTVRFISAQDLPDWDPIALPAWAAGIFGLDIEVVGPAVPSWFCGFTSIRNLHVSPHLVSKEDRAVKSLPACLGAMSQLLHVNVVGCNLTGPESMPPELGNLTGLRMFEAFENGKLGHDEEEHACPGDWVPDRSRCVPGYVARADGTPPVWRCPVHGWNIRLDDMSLPWWRWRSLEKMHLDANFIHGGIPEDLPQHWPHLRSLDLHDMNLTGPLPMSLTQLENLTQLQVQLNDLHCSDGADVVAELLMKPKMRTLSMDANPKLCGCVPKVVRPHLRLQVGETSIKVGCDAEL
ncbi:unnamed protein product [Effrenium voratum]|nr:unnamed protein product [Effrenium voratum]